ncbi:MAG: hypothetical protein ACMG6S_21965 [Byssovorax sp.]
MASALGWGMEAREGGYVACVRRGARVFLHDVETDRVGILDGQGRDDRVVIERTDPREER